MTAGRTDLSRRALERAMTATAASVLEVPVGDVAVRLADARGELALSVTAPTPLDRSAGLLTRSAVWRDELRERAAAVTGLVVGGVHLHITSIGTTKKGRVR